MTTAGDAHVSINGVKYLLDEGTPDHYVHEIPGDFPHDSASIAIQGTQQLQTNRHRLLWAMSDWVGGEGNRVYYSDDPGVYDYSVALNTRIPGQFTARPKRDTQSA